MTIKVKDVKLEQVIKPGRKIKEEIQESDFIIVTSREIDEICEGDNIILARKIMNDILGEVGRAIRNLSRLGVERFVITGDHGYLFGEELTEAMKVDPPGGNTWCVHRRFWAGYGGNADDYYFRVSSLQLGLTGDLEFAFPKGMAGFKAKGGARAYFHGGMSLQELIIPVITIHASGGQKPPSGQNIFEIQADRKKITSPFFTVKVRYRWSGLFGEEMCRVQMVVKSGRAVAGRVATAVYGHEPGTSEVTLKEGEKNFVTLMLNEDCRDKQVVVSVLDRETGRELARSDKLEVSLIS